MAVSLRSSFLCGARKRPIAPQRNEERRAANENKKQRGVVVELKSCDFCSQKPHFSVCFEHNSATSKSVSEGDSTLDFPTPSLTLRVSRHVFKHPKPCEPVSLIEQTQESLAATISTERLTSQLSLGKSAHGDCLSGWQIELGLFSSLPVESLPQSRTGSATPALPCCPPVGSLHDTVGPIC